MGSREEGVFCTLDIRGLDNVIRTRTHLEDAREAAIRTCDCTLRLNSVRSMAVMLWTTELGIAAMVQYCPKNLDLAEVV